MLELPHAIERPRERQALEMAEQAEDVALYLRQRVPPAPPFMHHDDDVVGAPELQGPARALPAVEREAGAREDRRAAHSRLHISI